MAVLRACVRSHSAPRTPAQTSRGAGRAEAGVASLDSSAARVEVAHSLALPEQERGKQLTSTEIDVEQSHAGQCDSPALSLAPFITCNEGQSCAEERPRLRECVQSIIHSFIRRRSFSLYNFLCIAKRVAPYWPWSSSHLVTTRLLGQRTWEAKSQRGPTFLPS